MRDSFPPRSGGDSITGSRRTRAARNRRLEVGHYDFATKYRVGFSPLPAFRDVAPEEYRQKVAALIGEIEEEGKRKRGEDSVAGVEKVLSQNPYEAPTRRAKRSARPVFHFHTADARESFMSELEGFLEEYRNASDALQSGRMEAIDWFPEGSYRPQLPFLGSPAPPCPPSPPTRRIEIEETDKNVKRVVARGAVPIVDLGGRGWSGSPDHPT